MPEMDKGVSIYSKRARVRGFRGGFGPSYHDPMAPVGVGVWWAVKRRLG